jgi:PAS domain S-box-containing protein
MKLDREAVDALAREVLDLLQRLRPVLEESVTSWPVSRSRQAAAMSRDLAAAVEALDLAVEELYFQTDSLESAHLALEVERRAYQELFEAGPDGDLVTDPEGVILRANARAGELFACRAEDLVGHPLPALVGAGDRPSLQATITGFDIAAWDTEWIGQAVRAVGPPFQAALTTTVVRHADGSGVSGAVVRAGHQPAAGAGLSVRRRVRRASRRTPDVPAATRSPTRPAGTRSPPRFRQVSRRLA